MRSQASNPTTQPIPPDAARRRERAADPSSPAAQAFQHTLEALVGPVAAGKAGVVRGRARDDSAAEWNARDAYQRRQNSPPGAHDRPGRAQATRSAPPSQGDRSKAGAPAQASPPPAAADANAGKASRGGGAGASAGAGESHPQPAARDPDARPPVHARVVPAALPQAHAAAGAGAAQASVPARGPAGVAGQPSLSAPASGGVRSSQAAAPKPPQPAARPNQARAQAAFEAQLGRGLARALRSGDGTVTLRLKPQSLGELRVEVGVDRGRVTAVFEAQSREARSMLEGAREGLRQQLEGRGLAVDRMEFRLAPPPDAARAAIGTALAWTDRDGRGQRHDRDADHHRRQPTGDRGAPPAIEPPAHGAEPPRDPGVPTLDAIA